MIGLQRVTNFSLPGIRTLIEFSAVISGWLLGGIVGIGTILFVIGIGPCVGLGLSLMDKYPKDHNEKCLEIKSDVSSNDGRGTRKNMKRTVTIPATIVSILIGLLIAIAGSEGSVNFNGVALLQSAHQLAMFYTG